MHTYFLLMWPGTQAWKSTAAVGSFVTEFCHTASYYNCDNGSAVG